MADVWKSALVWLPVYVVAMKFTSIRTIIWCLFGLWLFFRKCNCLCWKFIFDRFQYWSDDHDLSPLYRILLDLLDFDLSDLSDFPWSVRFFLIWWTSMIYRFFINLLDFFDLPDLLDFAWLLWWIMNLPEATIDGHYELGALEVIQLD